MEFDIDKIEQYINGQLKGTELIEFNKKILEDSTFATEVEVRRTLIKGIRKKGDALDRDFLKSIHQEAKQKGLVDPEKIAPIKKEASVFTIRRTLAIAASLLLAFVAYTYFSGAGSRIQQAPIAFGKKTRINMAREIKATLGGNLGFAEEDRDKEELLRKKQVDSLLTTGWAYIADQNEYDLAIPVFKEVLTLDPLETRAIHGLAECNFQKGEYKKAMDLMKKLIPDANYDWINDVRFRYAQCLRVLNIGNNASVQKWHQMIIDDPNGSPELQELAQQYLKSLK